MAYQNHIVSQLKRRVQQRVKSAQPLFLNVHFFNRLSISHKLNVGFGMLVILTFLVVGRNAAVFLQRKIFNKLRSSECLQRSPLAKHSKNSSKCLPIFEAT